jgi:MoxR-like ATPase
VASIFCWNAAHRPAGRRHLLLEGLPGLAKTLAVRTLSATIDCDCRRVQFTPDLLPADLIGTLIYNQRSGDFTVQKGPIFTNILLADEINRAPAKVQSALLEAMQEKQVTIGGETHRLLRSSWSWPRRTRWSMKALPCGNGSTGSCSSCW